MRIQHTNYQSRFEEQKYEAAKELAIQGTIAIALICLIFFAEKSSHAPSNQRIGETYPQISRQSASTLSTFLTSFFYN